MDSQRVARVTGVLFILTFVTGIAGRLLFQPLWSDPGNIAAGSDTRIYLGAVFEFLVVVTNIGTALVLYPLVKRQSEAGAIAYVSARIMESAVIMIGLLSLLSVVTLRQDLAGAAATDAGSLVTSGTSLVATYKWAFLFGPGLIAGIGNGLILGYLMYRSGLVPRRMATLGLIGGPLLIVAFFGVLFGAFEANSAPQFLLTAVEIAWEAAFGIYLTWKGFKRASVSSIDVSERMVPRSMAAV